MNKFSVETSLNIVLFRLLRMLAKLTIFILIFSIVQVHGIVTESESDSNYDDKFNNWKKVHQKSFTSQLSEQKAKKNFKENLREIDLHNIRYKAGMETYSRALWSQSDLSFDEKVQTFATLKLNESQILLQSSRMKQLKLKSGPTEINFVKLGRVGKVEDQGRCGSCYTFTAVGVVEGIMRKNGNETRLSKQQIVDCDQLDEGCNGLYVVLLIVD